jgi:hypothetical protein
MGLDDPLEMSMVVEEVFFVAAPGKGTILTGHLHGQGKLRVGDDIHCGEKNYELLGIEQFRRVLKEITGEANVGLALGTEIAKEGFAGQTVTFGPRAAANVPALTPDGWVVPNRVAVLVGWSERRGVPRARVGTLRLDGLRVALLDEDDTALVDAPGTQIRVSQGSTWLSVQADGAPPFFVIGPSSVLGLRAAAGVRERHQAWAQPDFRVLGPNPWWYRLLVLPAARVLRVKHVWKRALLAMLQTRGVTIES